MVRIMILLGSLPTLFAIVYLASVYTIVNTATDINVWNKTSVFLQSKVVDKDSADIAQHMVKQALNLESK